jgi:hypothetical protein
MRYKLLLAVIGLVTLVGAAVYLWNAQEAAAEKARAQKENDFRDRLPFVSVVERLPKGKPITPKTPLNEEAVKRWEILDRNLASSQDERANTLKALHERTRKFFVKSQGAGPVRSFRVPDEDILLDNRSWQGGDPRQPGEPASFPLSGGEVMTRVEPNEEYYFYHEGGLEDFLYPRGFGYIKDREHVAGFESHGFRYLAVPVHESKRWRVHYIQLVGILTHEKPVVYLTDKLPSMEQVRQGKTRSLDFFEQAALPSLRDGEDLYIVSKNDTLRMLGAIRATKTCQKCHDAEVGDLLGAFSYTLRPAPKDREVER